MAVILVEELSRNLRLLEFVAQIFQIAMQLQHSIFKFSEYFKEYIFIHQRLNDVFLRITKKIEIQREF